MSMIIKEVIRELIKESKFTSATMVMSAIKDMFKDVLQEITEAELNTELGYNKKERRSDNTGSQPLKNYRNGYSKKTVKTQLGEVEINVPVTVTVVTKTKSSFLNDDSLRKMLYLASQNIVKKWTQRYPEWDMILDQLSIIFGNQAAG